MATPLRVIQTSQVEAFMGHKIHFCQALSMKPVNGADIYHMPPQARKPLTAPGLCPRSRPPQAPGPQYLVPQGHQEGRANVPLTSGDPATQQKGRGAGMVLGLWALAGGQRVHGRIWQQLSRH